MSYEAILLDVKDEVATITLNRPERLNAWTPEMAVELSDPLTPARLDTLAAAYAANGQFGLDRKHFDNRSAISKQRR